MHKREVIEELVGQGIPERSACRAAGVNRSTFQYPAQAPDTFGEMIRQQVIRLAHQHRRYGVARVTALLQREGHVVNHKRIHRIWKQERLQVPRKRPRKRIKGVSTSWPTRATHPNHVWTYDFLFDWSEAKVQLKFLVVLDEWTRESLKIRVGRNLDSRHVRETLEGLFKERGLPEHIRSDNGPEFIERELQRWLGEQGAKTIYIEPGHPWENGFAESFIGKFRDECLNEEIFFNEMEAQVVVDAWRRHYNYERPHSSLGYRTPAEVALNPVGPSAALVASTTGRNI